MKTRPTYRRPRLHCEALECRVVPATLLVDHTGTPGHFSTIQAAVTAAAPNDTISVAAGTYQENVTINKPLTLIGAEAGVDARNRSVAGESVVLTNGNQNAIFTITSSNVTIDGFKIDGDDTSVTGTPLTSGDDANVSYGIRANGSYSNLTVRNNIITHASMGFRGDGFADDNLITQNWFDSIGFYDWGYAVSLRSDFYADVTDNLMTRVQSGLATNVATIPDSSGTWLFQGNTVEAYGAGVWYNQGYSTGTPLTIDSNTISGLTAPSNAANNAVRANYDGQSIGIFLTTVTVNGSTITNNSVSGMGYGITLFDTSASTPLSLDGTNHLTNNGVGVYLTNKVDLNPVSMTGLGGTTAPPGYSGPYQPTGIATVNLNGIDLSGNTTGILARDDNTATIYGVQLTATNATVSGGVNGLVVDGARATIAGNTLNNLVFNGQTGQYIQLANGALAGQTLDATGVTFNGKTGATASLAQNFAIEDKITHAVDDASLGFVRVKAGNVFVTQASGSIQRGVNVANANDTINVNSGTYNEDVNLTVGGKTGLQLIGAGAATTKIVGPLGGANETLLIGQNQVVDGFTITRVTGTGENNIGVAITTGSTGSIIRNNVFTGNNTAIAANGGNSASTIIGNTIDSNQTGIVFADPSYGAYQIINNAITNNQTFGINFQNTVTSVNTGLNIFDNNISGNNSDQLENDTNQVVNASGNWWGTNGVPASANNDFTPYLATGTNTATTATGFQGDFSNLIVTPAGAQSGSTGRIQEGINAVTSGGTVHVLAGTYTGGVYAGGTGATIDPAGATLADATGITTLTGGFTLDSSNTLDAQINGTTPGTNYDQIDVTGGVTLNGAMLNLTLGYTPAVGDKITLINNASVGAVTGTFGGLNGVAGTLAEGDIITLNGQQFKLSYVDGDGNDVTLTVMDNIAPTVAISAPSATVANGTSTVTYTITYTDANFASSSLSLADVTLNKTGTANATVSVDNSTGATRTVTLSNITGNGTLSISLAAGTAVDTAGNLAPTAGPSAVVSVDTTAPTVAITGPVAGANGTQVYTVTYTDANFASSSLTAANVTLNKTGTANATVSVDNSTGATRTVTLSNITGNGTLSISLAAGTAVDTAGNLAPTAGPSAVYTVVTPPPGLTTLTAAAPGAGGSGTVTVYNPDGSVAFTSNPFGFTGATTGLRAVVGKFNNDSTPDLVVGTGPGARAQVAIVDGATGETIRTLTPFEDSFTGGVFVAVGDVNGDGIDDIAVSADLGGGGRVTIYNGATGAVITDFFAIDDPNFRGGSRVAFGDVNGDGHADLIVAAGFGGGPRISIYDGKSISPGSTPTHLVNDFYAFESTLRNGAYVAAGDVNGDGYADLVFGGGPGGGPRVLVVSGKALMTQGESAAFGAPIANFYSGDAENRNGIRVAVKNLDNDQYADVVTGSGQGDGSSVLGYYGKDLVAGDATKAFSLEPFGDFAGGVFVG